MTTFRDECCSPLRGECAPCGAGRGAAALPRPRHPSSPLYGVLGFETPTVNPHTVGISDFEFEVWGERFWAWGFGDGVWGLGFRVKGLGSGVWDLGLGFRV